MQRGIEAFRQACLYYVSNDHRHPWLVIHVEVCLHANAIQRRGPSMTQLKKATTAEVIAAALDGRLARNDDAEKPPNDWL